jgi:membrane protease YdiL (CAAX protease family)
VDLRRLESFEFMNFAELFIDENRRLRSGWRFAIFVVGFVFIATFTLTLSTLLIYSVRLEGALGSAVSFILSSVALLLPALIVGWLCNRFLDRLPFQTLGASFTHGWFKHLALGALIGALTLCAAVGIAIGFGGLSFVTDQVDLAFMAQTLALSFLVFLVAAAAEEALFRGYAMQTFFHSDLRSFGVLFTAVLFATVHVHNPSADFLSWLNTFLAGIWFGVAYWKSRDLWLPFGMHLMWNWMQGAIFGIEVSGLTDLTSAPLLKEIDRGPWWLTGETYGIEAGVASTVALVISTIVVYFLPDRNNSDSQV